MKETLERWKWACIELLAREDEELILDLMRQLECSSSERLPAEETISWAMKVLLERARNRREETRRK